MNDQIPVSSCVGVWGKSCERKAGAMIAFFQGSSMKLLFTLGICVQTVTEYIPTSQPTTI